MSIDIYFPEDIRNAILAANEAGSATAAMIMEAEGDPRLLRAYRIGYRSALVTLALAFGVADKLAALEPTTLAIPARAAGPDIYNEGR